MALTRANVEALLVKRIGPIFEEVSLDGTTVDGTNADLNDPIGWAVAGMDETVDDRTTVDDEDIARVAAADYNQFLDLAELRSLQTALNAYLYVDIKTGPRSESLSQLGERIGKIIDRKLASMEKDYGYGLGAPTAGYVRLEIAEHETS